MVLKGKREKSSFTKISNPTGLSVLTEEIIFFSCMASGWQSQGLGYSVVKASLKVILRSIWVMLGECMAVPDLLYASPSCYVPGRMISMNHSSLLSLVNGKDLSGLRKQEGSKSGILMAPIPSLLGFSAQGHSSCQADLSSNSRSPWVSGISSSLDRGQSSFPYS